MSSVKLSFEFFPPRSEEAMQQLLQTASDLSPFLPNFFSVTYGAGGSTREGTTKTLLLLREKTGQVIAPHLSCIGMKREEIIEVIKLYHSLGVKRIVALRGDLPSGMGQIGEVMYATELVRMIRETTGDHFHIEVAAYPDIHPQASNVQQDILNLKQKAEAGANSAITQYFYNADAFFRLLDECEKHHINIPIVPGIMPIIQFSRLVRFSEACGAEIPRWIRKRFESYGDDQVAIQQFGFEVVLRLCEQLIKNGVKAFHFYTLNRSELSKELINALFGEMPTSNHQLTETFNTAQNAIKIV